jgi:Putative phage serine protease XkdF
MDADQAVATLHRIDPVFRDLCETLYPGLEPRQIVDVVYKGNPDSADSHVMSTQWRNGRGHTKGRGRRKIDNTVLSTRFVGKSDVVKLLGKPKTVAAQQLSQPAGPTGQTGSSVSGNHSGLARGIGLGTTAVGTGISAVSLPKHLKEIPSAFKNARTGPNARQGIKSAVKTVRTFAKPAQAALPGMEAEGGAVKTGFKALKAGASVARENPRISAGLLLGATALHTANLAGEAIATHVLHNQKPPKPKTIPAPALQRIGKAWDDAQALIVKAHHDGLISKAEALDLGRAVHHDLMAKASTGSMGGSMTSGNIQLKSLKAPPPVKLEQPRLPMTRTQLPAPGKSGAGRKKGKEVKKSEGLAASKQLQEGVEYIKDTYGDHTLDISGEISKLNVAKQQCFGWCSVVKIDGKDVIDKQNDIIDIDDIEEAAYDYVLNSRKGGDMHQRAEDGGVLAKAEMIESFVLTPEKIAKMGLPDSVPQGWWIGMKVHDPQLWDDVEHGKKRKFSIHGTGTRTEVLVDD